MRVAGFGFEVLRGQRGPPVFGCCLQGLGFWGFGFKGSGVQGWGLGFLGLK